MMASVEGTTVWHRSKRGADCICCEGLHIFAYGVEGIEGDPTPNMTALESWLYQQVRSAPEGAHLRFTVDVVTDS